MNADDDVSAIARLIFNADPYIYRGLFGDEDKATIVLSSLLKKDDGIFSHRYTHVVEYDGKIAGTAAIYNILLKTKDDEMRKESFAKFGRVTEEFDTVVRHLKKMKNVISRGYRISRFCIDEKCRRNGLGSSLIKYLIKKYEGSDLELAVLEGNKVAINMYKKHDFTVKERDYGYGKDQYNNKVYCLSMVRKASG